RPSDTGRRRGAIVPALARAGLLVQASPSADPATWPEITGLTTDSRRVERGMLFCAVHGAVQAGHRFVPAAAAAGAVAAPVEARQAGPLLELPVRGRRPSGAVAAERGCAPAGAPP